MTENTFFGGAFHKGTGFDYRVEETVHTCEYHLPFYLSMATLGQEVAVGTLCLPVELTEEEMADSHLPRELYGPSPVYSRFSFDLLIVPGTGVWLIDTLWKDGKREIHDSNSALKYFERGLGRSRTEMPIRRAFFRVNDGPAPKLRGIPPTMVYGPDDYPRVAHELISRLPADHPFDEIDPFISELLEMGEWLDAKAPDSIYFEDWNIPTWLAEKLSIVQIDQAV